MSQVYQQPTRPVNPQPHIPIHSPAGHIANQAFDCSICLEDLNTTQLSMLFCGHTFHSLCIDTSIENR